MATKDQNGTPDAERTSRIPTIDSPYSFSNSHTYCGMSEETTHFETLDPGVPRNGRTGVLETRRDASQSPPPAASTIARIPARMASGSLGHAAITRATPESAGRSAACATGIDLEELVQAAVQAVASVVATRLSLGLTIDGRLLPKLNVEGSNPFARS